LLLATKSILSDYRAIEFVGKGSWGYVYKARHPTLPRWVAIKQLKPRWIADQGALQRFLREAEVVARLNDPNVVTIYDRKHDEESGSYYIITEFTDQGTLEDLLRQSPAGLPFEQIVHLAMGICSGLQAVHRQGVVHRDIKPSNVLLFHGGEGRLIPKLSDFGIAKVPTSSDADSEPSSAIYGSLYYISPEQLDKSLPVDGRADLYSLGILIYELITSQVPFTGSIDEIIVKHTIVEPTAPQQLRPDTPSLLQEIVMRALRKSPRDRYQSASDMHEALSAVLDATIRERRRRRFRTLVRRGLEHLRKGEWDDAAEVLRQADVLEPGDERVRAGLRKCEEQQGLGRLYDLATQHLDHDNWEKAREYLSEILSVDPAYAQGHAQEQLDLATAKIEQRRSNEDLMVQYRRGMGLYRTQEWPQAISYLRWVVDQDQGFEDAADRLAEAQDYAKAHRLFDQAQACVERTEWEQAVSLLEAIRSLAPPDVDVTQDLANARVELAKLREEQLLVAWYDAGIAQLQPGNIEQARTYLQQVQDRRPDYRDAGERLAEIDKGFDISARLVRASQLEELGEFNSALNAYLEILLLDRSNRKALRRLAVLGQGHPSKLARVLTIGFHTAVVVISATCLRVFDYVEARLGPQPFWLKLLFIAVPVGASLVVFLYAMRDKDTTDRKHDRGSG
jgi:serine/threonine protein kinase